MTKSPASWLPRNQYQLWADAHSWVWDYFTLLNLHSNDITKVGAVAWFVVAFFHSFRWLFVFADVSTSLCLWPHWDHFHLLTFLGFWVPQFVAMTSCLGCVQLRKQLRPHFQTTARRAKLYDILTFFATHLCMSYVGFPFMLLEFIPCIRVYRSEIWNT